MFKLNECLGEISENLSYTYLSKSLEGKNVEKKKKIQKRL